MVKYQPPEGYVLDPTSGLYFMQFIYTEDNGQQQLYTNWFNAETGAQSQSSCPYVQPQIVTQNVQHQPMQQVFLQQPQPSKKVKQKQAKPQNKEKMRGQEKRVPAVIAISLSVVVLVSACVLFFVVFKTPKSGDYQTERLYACAEAAFRAAAYDKAIEYYEEILAKDKAESYAYLGIASAYRRTGNDASAKHILEEGYAMTKDKEIANAMEQLEGVAD
ncbi:MAG: tetratricopeptide repeat protein [Lachnospiraceae bacterium]|nr:tetratricopeptide repeat protein [Lachnospiraceae bacterium]